MLRACTSKVMIWTCIELVPSSTVSTSYQVCVWHTWLQYTLGQKYDLWRSQSGFKNKPLDFLFENCHHSINASICCELIITNNDIDGKSVVNSQSLQQYLMGPRLTQNNTVLDLPSSVELISTLEAMCFGTNHEVTQCIQHIKYISTGRRMHSKCNAPVDHLVVHFWCDKVNLNLASLLTLPVPNWCSLHINSIKEKGLHTGVEVPFLTQHRDSNNQWYCHKIFQILLRDVTACH